MVVVAQLGARMHYAVPAILARSGMLERMYTDIFAPRIPRTLRTVAARFGPAPLRRWLGRVPAGIPQERIVSFNSMGLEYYRRRRRVGAQGSTAAVDLWAGQELCRRVIQRGLGKAECVFTYNSAGLELMRHARSLGVRTVMEQTVAPAGILGTLIDAEQSLHPNWECPRGRDPFQNEFSRREAMEWGTADIILCGSEFVRESIRASCGPVERCRVVPYGVNLPISVARDDLRRRRLRVLTVGAVGLRKGAPYVLAAARILEGKAEFRMAGQLDVTPYAQKLLSEHVTLLNSVPRSEIHRQFAWADVFLLPSLCEGSATVCYEALSHGLPVITTPNAGSVVRDGVDGFIVPIRDSAAIADRIERLADNGELWAEMSANARLHAADYSLEKYGERLLRTLSDAGLTVN